MRYRRTRLFAAFGGFLAAALLPAEAVAQITRLEIVSRTTSTDPACTLPANPNPQTDQTRALTVALVEWVTKGTEPPASRYPLLSRGELVPASRGAVGFPDVPGIPFTDTFVNSVLDYDFGQEFRANDLSGVITRQPPRIVRIISTYVSRVDKDGNEVSGAPSVLHQVPLATYLGWNVTRSGFAKGRICGFNGGAVPFAKTRAERIAGDPRLSVEERYGTLEGYVCAVRAAADRMVADRLLLAADAERTIRQARESNVLPVSGASGAEARAVEARLCGASRLAPALPAPVGAFIR